jgi:hypothetical protein
VSLRNARNVDPPLMSYRHVGGVTLSRTTVKTRRGPVSQAPFALLFALLYWWTARVGERSGRHTTFRPVASK